MSRELEEININLKIIAIELCKLNKDKYDNVRKWIE